MKRSNIKKDGTPLTTMFNGTKDFHYHGLWVGVIFFARNLYLLNNKPLCIINGYFYLKKFNVLFSWHLNVCPYLKIRGA